MFRFPEFARLFFFLGGLLIATSSRASIELHHVDVHDLYFGEVLYDAYQNNYFKAISKLDNELEQYSEVDEKKLDPLHSNIGQAEFLVGDLALQYRMNQRAGKAIQAVLGDGVDQATRNRAALKLAQLFFKKGEPQKVIYALDLISDKVHKSRYETLFSFDLLRRKPPQTLKKEAAYLRALAYINTGKNKPAIKILQSLKHEKLFQGFDLYNLGIAQIQAGKLNQGEQTFDELGKLDVSDPELLALRDKANLKLAEHYVKQGKAVLAEKYFRRVRLQGPYSNKALLGAGWVAASQGRFDRALVPWTLLHQRSEYDSSVQEAMMAVPYAYGKLKAYGKSANLYGQALDVFASEIQRLGESIKSIREGSFLHALLDKHGDADKNWVVNLRHLKDAPETRYTLDLMASSDFQECYKNYKDLASLRHYLTKWLDDLNAYEELIEKRRLYQQPLLPVVEKKFRKIDARMKLRLEQRKNLDKKIQNMLIAPRPEYLATDNERIAMDKLTQIKNYLALHPDKSTDEIKNRLDRLDGILLWEVRSDFNQRLTDAYNHLHKLDGIIKILKLRYYSFIRTRQAATQSYKGYRIPIQQFRTRILAVQKKLNQIMAQQGHVIEQMASTELDKRRKQLEDYQIKARFALAESYDRAIKSRQDKEVEKRYKKLTGKNRTGKKVPQKRPVENKNASLENAILIKQQLEQQQKKIKKQSGIHADALWSKKKNRQYFSTRKYNKSWIKNNYNPVAGSK